MSRTRALLLVVLTAVLTALAGPSAAAHVDPSDVPTASVLGVAPNGDDAIARAGHLVHPVPPTVASTVPGGGRTRTAPVRPEITVQSAHRLSSDAGATSRHDRAPPG